MCSLSSRVTYMSSFYKLVIQSIWLFSCLVGKSEGKQKLLWSHSTSLVVLLMDCLQKYCKWDFEEFWSLSLWLHFCLFYRVRWFPKVQREFATKFSVNAPIHWLAINLLQVQMLKLLPFSFSYIYMYTFGFFFRIYLE